MVNRVTNTPIQTGLYNCRALSANNYVTKNCIRQPDGTLWALIIDYAGKANVLRSENDGFSWEVVLEGIETAADMREHADFSADGFIGHLVIDEKYRNFDIYMGEWENIGGDGSAERKRYDLDGPVEDDTPDNTTVLSTTNDPFQAMFDICWNKEQTFLVWVKESPVELYVTRCSPRTTSVSSADALGTGEIHYGLLSSCCNEDGDVFIAYEVLEGGTNRVLRFTHYTSIDGNFTTPVDIEDMGATGIARDINIARDGLGNLCVVWFDQGDEEVRYATSIDNGANWDVNSLVRTTGHAVYTDATTSDKEARTSVIGGSKGGFLFSYCEDNSVNTPRCYVRQLTTSDAGSTYDLGDEQEVATSDPYSTSAITGVKFFLPLGSSLLDITDPGKVRIAFTVGEGDSETMADTQRIDVGQELLYQSAFPSSLTSEADTHSIDTADSVSLRVLVDILAGPNDNIDFYGAGLTGGFTERYAAAFRRIGTNFRLLAYQPDADNEQNDITAYGAPTEYSTLALLDPVTYSFPSPGALNTSDTVQYIEQDVRKLHLPPDFHLARTWIVNKGGYLKRTVWLVEFDDNQYELSQVVPRFINNQICYYECNAYVIGPSRDPFSRTVLPSET